VFDDDGRLVGIHDEGAAGGQYAVAVKLDSAVEALAALGHNTPNLARAGAVVSNPGTGRGNAEPAAAGGESQTNTETQTLTAKHAAETPSQGQIGLAFPLLVIHEPVIDQRLPQIFRTGLPFLMTQGNGMRRSEISNHLRRGDTDPPGFQPVSRVRALPEALRREMMTAGNRLSDRSGESYRAQLALLAPAPPGGNIRRGRRRRRNLGPSNQQLCVPQCLSNARQARAHFSLARFTVIRARLNVPSDFLAG
jgi:hypothetical protein